MLIFNLKEILVLKKRKKAKQIALLFSTNLDVDFCFSLSVFPIFPQLSMMIFVFWLLLFKRWTCIIARLKGCDVLAWLWPLIKQAICKPQRCMTSLVCGWPQHAFRLLCIVMDRVISLFTTWRTRPFSSSLLSIFVHFLHKFVRWSGRCRES